MGPQIWIGYAHGQHSHLKLWRSLDGNTHIHTGMDTSTGVHRDTHVHTHAVLQNVLVPCSILAELILDWGGTLL